MILQMVKGFDLCHKQVQVSVHLFLLHIRDKKGYLPQNDGQNHNIQHNLHI